MLKTAATYRFTKIANWQSIVTKVKPKFHLVIALPLIFFLWVGTSRVISHFPSYDDAYNATIAKNIAYGYGYASSFNSPIYFDPEITTGPALILPAAIFIDIFGTTYWVPAFTTLFVAFILLFFITKLLLICVTENALTRTDSTPALIYFTFVVSLLITFWTPEVEKVSLVGEFPSALFICLGALLIFMQPVNTVRIFLGGLLLGLSITTKLVALILVAPIFLFWVVFCLFDGSVKVFSVKKVNSIVIIACGIVLPSVLFECYKIVIIGFSEFYRLKILEFNIFKTKGSGIAEIAGSPGIFEYAFTNFSRNVAKLQSRAGNVYFFYIYVASLCGILVGLGYKIFTRSKLLFWDRLALALVLSVMIYMTWWLFFGHKGSYRHVSPAIIVYSFGFIVSLLALFGKKALPASGVILVFWCLIAPIQWSAIFNVPQMPTNRIYATTATAKFLSGLKSEGKILLGCGWWANRRLEYFMPECLNFKQCYLQRFNDRVLVIDRQFWNWEKNKAIRVVETICSHLIYENKPYQVFQCN